MKILYLHNTAEISGGERSLLSLWKNLDHSFFEPMVVLPYEGPLSQAARDLGVKVEVLSIPKLHPLNILKILGAMRVLRALISRNDIGLVHSYSPRNNILSAWVCRGLRVPVIWHERNLIFGDEKDVSVRFYALASRIICNSKAVAARFSVQKDSAAKVKVVLNGVDLNHFRPGSEDGIKKSLGIGAEKVIGMTTNLNKRKRVEFLLKALALVREK
ncbi:MAG: glycosyltransferase, partial [Candidatus Omnitrophica bacterium]|nr:glycosyltransferase [Candidatus Omnitrophota bacterium]